VIADRAQRRAARQHAHVVAGAREQRGEQSADAACSDDGDDPGLRGDSWHGRIIAAGPSLHVRPTIDPRIRGGRAKNVNRDVRGSM
jgi:hypothetical protein